MRFMAVLFSLALMGCVNAGSSASAGAIGGGEPGTQQVAEQDPPVQVTPSEGDSCIMVEVCYDPSLVMSDMRGNLAWSEGNKSSNDWSHSLGYNLDIGSDGCFSVCAEVVCKGFWTDLTRGPAENNLWQGDSIKPLRATVNGITYTNFEFNPFKGWFFANQANIEGCVN